ncbi:MAG: IS1 family transposase [Clostridium sp.]|nr:IS1 family transposase [Clostridium sp.]
MIEVDVNFKNIDNYLKTALKSNVYEMRKDKVNVCPKCGHNHYIKYGFFKGIQRYRCKKCNKTFSLVTNSIWSYSKKDPSKWMKFIEFMLEKRTLQYCSEKLNININTAFYWRHKVLNAMTYSNIPKTLVGKVHMIKTSIKENFKGNKHIDTDVREKVFVVSARGREDSILSLPVCRKRWDINKFNDKIYSRLAPNSVIIPYVDRYIRIIAERHNKNKKKNYNKIDELISNFKMISKLWFKPFYGVATKYLKEYFCWFIIFNIRKKVKNMSFFKELLCGESFIKIEQIGI